MTRKEILTARANDVVEAALSKEVCLSEAECQIMREVVLYELMRVEREVWGNVAEHLESEAAKSRSFENALGRRGEMGCASDIQTQRLTEESYAAWARRQQKELGA